MEKTDLKIEGEVITLSSKKLKWCIEITMDGKKHRQIFSKGIFDNIGRAKENLHKEMRKIVRIYGDSSKSLEVKSAGIPIKGREVKKTGCDVVENEAGKTKLGL